MTHQRLVDTPGGRRRWWPAREVLEELLDARLDEAAAIGAQDEPVVGFAAGLDQPQQKRPQAAEHESG